MRAFPSWSLSRRAAGVVCLFDGLRVCVSHRPALASGDGLRRARLPDHDDQDHKPDRIRKSHFSTKTYENGTKKEAILKSQNFRPRFFVFSTSQNEKIRCTSRALMREASLLGLTRLATMITVLSWFGSQPGLSGTCQCYGSSRSTSFRYICRGRDIPEPCNRPTPAQRL